MNGRTYLRTGKTSSPVSVYILAASDGPSTKGTLVMGFGSSVSPSLCFGFINIVLI